MAGNIVTGSPISDLIPLCMPASTQLTVLVSPQACKSGTQPSVAGNIVTGSPISDLNPLWMAARATFVVKGKATPEREVCLSCLNSTSEHLQLSHPHHSDHLLSVLGNAHSGLPAARISSSSHSPAVQQQWAWIGWAMPDHEVCLA